VKKIKLKLALVLEGPEVLARLKTCLETLDRALLKYSSEETGPKIELKLCLLDNGSPIPLAESLERFCQKENQYWSSAISLDRLPIKQSPFMALNRLARGTEADSWLLMSMQTFEIKEDFFTTLLAHLQFSKPSEQKVFVPYIFSEAKAYLGGRLLGKRAKAKCFSSLSDSAEPMDYFSFQFFILGAGALLKQGLFKEAYPQAADIEFAHRLKESSWQIKACADLWIRLKAHKTPTRHPKMKPHEYKKFIETSLFGWQRVVASLYYPLRFLKSHLWDLAKKWQNAF